MQTAWQVSACMVGTHDAGAHDACVQNILLQK
jgi:hypothetical protein